MKTIKILSLFLLIISLQIQLFGQDYKYLDNKAGLSEITSSNGIDKPVTIKIIYDNYVHENGLKPDWGYSIIIEGLEKGILFDAGTRPDIFEFNFKKMDLDAGKVDLIPFSFSGAFKNKMVSFGLTPVLVKEPVKICDNMYTSGEFAYQIPEQALVLNTKNGLVIITGCSHPGIVEMLKEIKSTFNKNIYMVFGGFHLLDKSEQEMNSIISELKSIGVVKCGATHCTGEKQIKMIRDAFGPNFVELGAGNSIVIN
ncbi:MAG: MBL fold metallo-hydrolase [Bacteroidia bacterium]|nr:MBL fold metallo-hydrolase [Bacteroidia bacterium]